MNFLSQMPKLDKIQSKDYVEFSFLDLTLKNVYNYVVRMKNTDAGSLTIKKLISKYTEYLHADYTHSSYD